MAVRKKETLRDIVSPYQKKPTVSSAISKGKQPIVADSQTLDFMRIVTKKLHNTEKSIEEIILEILPSMPQTVQSLWEVNNREAEGFLKNISSLYLYQQWRQLLLASKEKPELKGVLWKPVKILTETELAAQEFESQLKGSRGIIALLAFLSVCNIILIYVLNQEWFQAMFHTPAAVLVFVIYISAFIISAIHVMKLAKTKIEYR